MAAPLIECVPNFSEGQRQEIIERIVAPFKGKKGVSLLDYRADPTHNRLVVSLVGAPDPIRSALLEAALVAVEAIDLNQHQGGHPRLGSVDVIPFVPVRNISMDDCVRIAREFGQAFFDQTRVPVYFYEEAALRPERKKLEKVRQGQFEGLKKDIARPERHPDVGPPQIHPTAGATIIGARRFLIAFNVNLATQDLDVARKIAKAVRASSGGLAHVKGIGLALEDRGQVQVSLNLVDHEKNPLYRVVEFIRFEAARYGVSIAGTEVYGLLPASALVDSLAYYLQMPDFDPRQVIELALLDQAGQGAQE